MRRKFYPILLAIFFPFFLLHWNGLFARTYYWALVERGSTSSFIHQFSFSLISALIIFSVPVLLFELSRLIRRRD